MYTKTVFLACIMFAVTMSQRVAQEKPLIEEHPDYVIFRTKICQPVPQDVLQSMLGADYDAEKMAPSLSKARQLVRRHRRSLDQAKPSESTTTSPEGDEPADSNWFIRRLQHRAASNQHHQSSTTTPWECKMAYRTRQNEMGVFPEFVVDGMCVTKKCFYELYQCEPVRYAVKVLQKDTSGCNPVPTIGNATVYQERWKLHTVHVTVACNCVASSLVKSQLQRNLSRKGG